MTTIASLLRRATTQLRPHIDNADFDARLLLAHTLGSSTSHLYSNAEAEVTAAETEQFKRLLARRITGEPLAYITGHCGFWTLDLRVNEAVLVPRPDTETLVEAALDLLPQSECHIVDLGTGSGAIALALASERPAWHITATDASRPALDCASANAKRLRLNHIQFRHGCWFEPLATARFDAIVSNPPYVAIGDHHLQAPELTYEPDAALVAGGDGLTDLGHIARNAPCHLNSGGRLLLEHGFEQGRAVRQLLTQAGFSAVHTLTDLAGRERVTLGQVV